MEQPINIFEKLLPHFSCCCEKMMDNMVARWRCPVHGKREPNYQQMFLAEELDAQERRIMAAEFRRDSKREEEMFEGKESYDPFEAADIRRKEIKEDELMRPIKRLPGDHDGWPSNEQMEYFKRGGR